MSVSRSFIIGVDISDNKDLSVLTVIEKKHIESINIAKVVKTFYGEEAEKLYDILVGEDYISESG